MQPYYDAVRMVHITAVIVSGGLFAGRGLALNVFGQRWVMAPLVRYLSYAIDTVLLAAAIALTLIIQQYPFADAWLTTKVLLLVVYIGLGSFALKRGRTRAARIVFWLLAMMVFAFIVGVARYHDPLGWFMR